MHSPVILFLIAIAFPIIFLIAFVLFMYGMWHEKWFSQKTRIFVTCGVAFLLIVAGLSGVYTDKQGKQEQKEIHYGDAFLQGPADEVIVGLSKESIDRFIEAIIKEDEYGAKELKSSGQIIYVPNRTRFLILETTGFLGAYYQVRILEGKYQNVAVWVQREQVKQR